MAKYDLLELSMGLWVYGFMAARTGQDNSIKAGGKQGRQMQHSTSPQGVRGLTWKGYLQECLGHWPPYTLIPNRKKSGFWSGGSLFRLSWNRIY